MSDFIDMNDLIDKANQVMDEMEATYGPEKAHKMARNKLDTLCRYDDKTDPRPFLEQFLYKHNLIKVLFHPILFFFDLDLLLQLKFYMSHYNHPN